MRRSMLLATVAVAIVSASSDALATYNIAFTALTLDRYKKGKKQAQWKMEQYGKRGKKWARN